MKTSALIYIFLLVSISLASYDNGRVDAGDKYDFEVYNHPSYTLYRFPWGIWMHQLVPQDDKLMILLHHIPCPGGTNCNEPNENSYFVRLSLTDMQVLQREIVPQGIYGQDSFPTGVINNKFYFIHKKFFDGQVCSIPISVGNATNCYPDESDLFQPSMGVVDSKNGRVIVYNDHTYLFHVFDESLKPIATLDVFLEIDVLSDIQVDPTSQNVLVAGLYQRKWKLVRYTWEANTWKNSSLELENFDSRFFLSKIVPYPTGHVFLTFENRTREVSNYQVNDEAHIFQIAPDFTVVKRLEFNMKYINGFFHDTVSDTLYLYGGSDLTRIQKASSNATYGGTMNLRFSWKRYLEADRKNNLVLSTGVYTKNGIAYLGTEGYGYLVKVDLTKFVKKEDDFPTDTMAIVGLFTSITISLVIICCLFCTLALFVILRRRQQRTESYEHLEE